MSLPCLGMQATLMETAQVLTLEAAALVERQTTALFGDVKSLQVQMTEAVGEDAQSMEDLMQRISDAVQNEKVCSLCPAEAVGHIQVSTCPLHLSLRPSVCLSV